MLNLGKLRHIIWAIIFVLSAFIFHLESNAQDILYYENFTQNDGKGQDGACSPCTGGNNMDGVSGWSIDVSNTTFSSADYFKVINECFESFNTDASSSSPVYWYSDTVNIECKEAEVSIDLGRAYSNSSSGVIAYYKILENDVWGSWVSFASKTGSNGTEAFETSTATDLTGDSICIKVEHFGTSSTPKYRHDNVMISVTDYPDTSPSAASISNYDGTSLDLSWTNGSGDKVIVVATELNQTVETPENGSEYSANSAYGSGDEIGSENFVVYNGTGTSVSISGLDSGTDYSFAIYSYESSCLCYNPNAYIATTYCTVPGTQVSAVTVSNTSYSSLDLDWTAGSGDNTLVVACSQYSVHSDPAIGTSYSANSAFGQGDEIGDGNYVIYDGTGTSVSVTSLAPSTQYTFSFYTYNTASECYNLCETRAYETTLFTSDYNIMDFDGVTITTNSGTFSDSNDGAFNDYGNNEDYTITFIAPDDKLLHFDFSFGKIDPSDELEIYQGTSTNDPLIVSLTGNTANGNKLAYFDNENTFQFHSPGSEVTFRFVSDASATDDGWSATISTVETISLNDNPDMADLFGGAGYVCNFYEYYGQTSAKHGKDLPANLDGGGGSCPTLFGGTIENNSWLKFEASDTDVDFDFTVISCANTGEGIQVAIFDYDGSDLTRKSDCSFSDGTHNGTFTVTASDLTIGETYYIMVDGNAGAVCDFKITASNDEEIVTVDAGEDQTICSGDPVSLEAESPGTSTTYTWTWDDGNGGPETGYAQTLYPSTTTDYIIQVDGACSTWQDTVKVTVQDCLLPVELTEFNAVVYNSSVILKWVTASETNNEKFILQKSANGVYFSDIATIHGNGNSIITNYYQYVDKHPIEGISYYRLKQVDFDGVFSVSNILAVSFLPDNQHEDGMDYSWDGSSLNVWLPKGVSGSYVTLNDEIGRLIAAQKINSNDTFIRFSLKSNHLYSKIIFITIYSNEHNWTHSINLKY
jgi:hypothetical protein